MKVGQISSLKNILDQAFNDNEVHSVAIFTSKSDSEEIDNIIKDIKSVLEEKFDESIIVVKPFENETNKNGITIYDATERTISEHSNEIGQSSTNIMYMRLGLYISRQRDKVAQRNEKHLKSISIYNESRKAESVGLSYSNFLSCILHQVGIVDAEGEDNQYMLYKFKAV